MKLQKFFTGTKRGVMKKDYFVVLDLGSSGFKCVLLNSKAEIVKLVQKPVKPRLPAPGHIEYDGEKLLKLQLSLLGEILNSAEGKNRIAAIAACSQRSTIVLWDSKTGKTLCPVLSWQDCRAGGELENIKFSNEEIHKITGLYKTPYYSAPKIKWCLKNFPQVADAYKKGTLLCGSPATYLIWHLTEKKVFAIDPTLAQRTILFDIKNLCWSQDLLKSFGIDRNILPRITPSIGNFGSHKGIPICAMLADQQAALAGAGAFGHGDAMINYGTGAFLLVNTGQDILNTAGLLTGVNWQTADGKTSYNLEGIINAAGLMFDWLKKLGFDFDTTKLDDYCKKSVTNPLVLPALGGLGSPYWDFNAEVVMAGLSPESEKQDILKGSLQGIAFLAACIVMHMKKNGVKLNCIGACGGLSKSDYLLGFQSDLMQVPVIRIKEPESTVMGVYYLMLQHLGIEIPLKPFLFPPLSKEGRGGILPDSRQRQGRTCGAFGNELFSDNDGAAGAASKGKISSQKAVKQPRIFTPKLTPSQSQQLFDCWHKFLELSQKISRI
jgi:glycerol kinase